MNDFSDLFDRLEGELNIVSFGDPNPDLEAAVDLLADGVTPEKDAEIAEALPVPYTVKVPARAQLDGEMLRCPRVAYVDASIVPDGEWRTSSARGQRLRRAKADVYMAASVELDIPDVVTIVKVAVLWRPHKE